MPPTLGQSLIMGRDSGYRFVNADGEEICEGDHFCTRNNRTIVYEATFSQEELITEINRCSQKMASSDMEDVTDVDDVAEAISFYCGVLMEMTGRGHDLVEIHNG